MPRRRRDPAADMIEDVVDTAVDAVFDKAGSVWRNFRDQRRQALPEDALRQRFTCAACRKDCALTDVEMVHPTNGFALCAPCFHFLWNSGAEKLKAFGQRAARQQQARPAGAPPGPQQQQRAAPPPPPPAGKAPWDVLGCAQSATVEQVRKAYRKQAMLWHPDRIPAGASSDEHLRAKAMFDEIQRAYKVMMSVRSAPEG